jgi:flagellar hook-length control protein FliK
MLQADIRTRGPEQAAPRPGGSGPSSGPAGSGSRDRAARERQVGPLAPDPDDHRPDHVVRAAAEQAPTIAEATMASVPSIGPSGDGQAAAIGPEVPAAHDLVEAEVTDRPDAGRPAASAAETESGPKQPISTPSPDQLLPPFDAPEAEMGRHDPAGASQRQADPASSDVGSATPAPAVASGTGFTIARQSPPQALDSGIARGARGTAGAALTAAVSTTEPSDAARPAEEHPTPPGGDQMARAVEPRRALTHRDGSDGDDQGLVQEKPAVADGPPSPQVRGTDPGAKQQPSSDVQPSRPLQISGPHGNAVAGAHPATAASGEVAEFIAGAPDGAVSVEPEPPPAIRQVALQITKGLDRDRTEIRIRLDPPELGEVDIQLEFRDLRLTASVSAERADTLELLQRDARSLTRALREAGLELADSDLSFAHNGRNDRPDAGSYPQRAINLPHPLPAAASLQDRSPALASPDGFVSLSDGRMDLRV